MLCSSLCCAVGRLLHCAALDIGPISELSLRASNRYIDQDSFFRQLASIDKWLSGVEFEMTSCEPLAATHDAALRQIEAHTRLQSKIHAYQDTINDLSSFVAVVSLSSSRY